MALPINSQKVPGGNLIQAGKFGPGLQPGIDQLIKQSLGQLSTNQQGGFKPIADQARQKFQTETIPGLAERFTALGNGQRSSAFQGALGSAASGLESNLASGEAQYGLQQNQQLMQLLQLLQPETVFAPESQGFLSSLLGGAAPGLGSATSSLLGGLGSSASGSAIGSGLGGLAGAGGIAALASQPWFWPVLAGLAGAGGLGYLASRD